MSAATKTIAELRAIIAYKTAELDELRANYTQLAEVESEVEKRLQKNLTAARETEKQLRAVLAMEQQNLHRVCVVRSDLQAKHSRLVETAEVISERCHDSDGEAWRDLRAALADARVPARKETFDPE